MSVRAKILLRPLTRWLVVAAVSAMFVVAAPAAHAQSQEDDGLMVAATTTFTPDPANEQIDVQAQYVMTNVQADEVLDGSVRSYYFTKWVIAMPANVTDFIALSNDQQLETEIEDDPNSEGIVFGAISLPFNLNFDETVTVDVSYTIPGGGPRGEGAVARVNDSFLSFSVWVSGDPGMTDVRIDIPDGFAMDLQGSLEALTIVNRDGERFYEALDLEAPRDFFGQIYGRNDSGLIVDLAELPGAQATVRAWPDDPEWVSFVVDAIEEDVPVIEDLIGIEWPAGDIEVIETITPYLYGYGGWFNAQSGLIEIGENLERDLILHELAHAWFNDDLIEGRWITEGLAEEFASRTIEATSGEQLVPDVPALADPVRVQLANWASPWTLNEEDAFAYEQFHYNASWWVIRQITNEIGLDAFSDVLISLRNDEMAYAGDGPLEQTSASTRWTHFFDLLDRQAGVSGLNNLFATYVLSADDAVWLDQRDQTLRAYDTLAISAQSWAPPLIVRRDLSAWDFDQATEHIRLATEIIATRDQVEALALALSVMTESDNEAAFETAMSLRDLQIVRADEERTLLALNNLSDARAELQERSAALSTSLSFDPMTLIDAQDDARTQRAAITTVTELRAQVTTRADDLGLIAPDWPQDADTTDFDAAASLAQARLTTLDALENARATAEQPRSFMQRMGLWGSNVDAELRSALNNFEADELDDALTSAAQTEAMIAASASTGTRRLIWAGSLLAVALVASLLLRRRTKI